MKLHSIHAGFFKLDGGAMFGVVPKTIWQKLNPADENNMCTWALRCLLIEDGNRLILVDNGLGNKQDAKFFSHYYLHGDQNLDSSLKEAGYSRKDITDMFLTHLHFDHCGGSIEYNSDRTKLMTAFPNATYWSNADHWKWATEPNPREKASFLKENILPIKESGQLKMVAGPTEPGAGSEMGENISITWVRGHTDAMMLPVILYKGKKIAYVSDLIPSSGHIPIPYVMGYDTRPLLTIEEKIPFLARAAKEDWILFFEHDPVTECCTLQETEKGVRMKEKLRISEL